MAKKKIEKAPTTLAELKISQNKGPKTRQQNPWPEMAEIMRGKKKVFVGKLK